jgi:hypothetical protein
MTTRNMKENLENGALTGNRHAPLKIPSLHDYPFISSIFARSIFAFTNSDGEEVASDFNGEQRIRDMHFRAPYMVQAKQMAPIEAMSNETFEKLFAILKPAINGRPISSKYDLEVIATSQEWLHLLTERTFSMHQMGSYLLFNADLSPNVQWAKVAQLFNNSEPDQKEAILQYFEEYKNRSLRWLLELTAMPVEIPSSLLESFESKEAGDDTYLYSNELERWLRDDRFYQQYRIDMVIKGGTSRHLIATAPTLKQAIAKATAHVKNGEFIPDQWCFEIHHNGLPVANALLQTISDKLPSNFVKRPVKLIWNREDLGVSNDYLDKIRKSGTTRTKIDAMLRNAIPIEAKAFVKTLFAVEKALGVTWSKVAKLEDELGL